MAHTFLLRLFLLWGLVAFVSPQAGAQQFPLGNGSGAAATPQTAPSASGPAGAAAGDLGAGAPSSVPPDGAAPEDPGGGVPAQQDAGPAAEGGLLEDGEVPNAFVSNVWVYRGLPISAMVLALMFGLIIHRVCIVSEARAWPATRGPLFLWLPPVITTIASFTLAGLVILWQQFSSDANGAMVANFSGVFMTYMVGCGVATIGLFVMGGVAGLFIRPSTT